MSSNRQRIHAYCRQYITQNSNDNCIPEIERIPARNNKKKQ